MVGGNSIFRGIGQNPDTLWTLELQKRLGDQFQILDFANNNAFPAAFSGVVLRMLTERYHKLIYLSTVNLSIGTIEGNFPYIYLFWDAYYKHLFHPDFYEKETLNSLRRQELKTASGLEMHFLAYLDSWFYFRNLWNWVGYNYLFTVWDEASHHAGFAPRKRFIDVPVDNELMKEKNDKNPDFIKFVNEQLQNIMNDTPPLFDKNKKDFNKVTIETLQKQFSDLFSPRYRSKILYVWVPIDPEHLMKIGREYSQEVAWTSIDLTSLLDHLGYNTLIIEGISQKEYLDFVHLLVHGGRQMADQIAPGVIQVAQRNGYLTASKKSSSDLAIAKIHPKF